ncbi:MAG: hypothetical protein JRJ85_00855 [Deltaproteobacteria bacterium]|nr:hypothetical protein [Deltaproteobacteria bacterium]
MQSGNRVVRAMKEEIRKQKRKIWHVNGVTYFDKKTERAVFFILTVAMLIWGILHKFGLL